MRLRGEERGLCGLRRPDGADCVHADCCWRCCWYCVRSVVAAEVRDRAPAGISPMDLDSLIQWDIYEEKWWAHQGAHVWVRYGDPPVTADIGGRDDVQAHECDIHRRRHQARVAILAEEHAATPDDGVQRPYAATTSGLHRADCSVIRSAATTWRRFLTREEAQQHPARRCSVCAPDLPLIRQPVPPSRLPNGRLYERSGLGWPDNENPGKCVVPPLRRNPYGASS